MNLGVFSNAKKNSTRKKMSRTSHLYIAEDGSLYTYCPVCGERIDVYEEDSTNEYTSDGYLEYYVGCERCDETFYTSTDPEY